MKTCDEFLAFLEEREELGIDMLSHDWTRSPLGHPAAWPNALRTTARLVLGSRIPMFLAWGPELACLYNASYTSFLGDKHPASLGKPFRAVWPEIWEEVNPLVQRTLGGDSVYFEDVPFSIRRNSGDDTVWVTFSYSPLHDDEGAIAGLLCIITDTTARVFAERRQSFELQMADSLHGLEDAGDILEASCGFTGRYLELGRVGYADIDEGKNLVHISRDWTSGSMTSLAGMRMPLDSFGEAVLVHLKAGKTLHIPDITADSRTLPYVERYADLSARALIVVPFLESRRLTAAMFVNHPEPRHWAGEEVELVEDIARRTWDALRRARVEEALREETRILELVNKTGQTLAATLDLSSLLQSITDAGRELTDAKFGAFFYNGKDSSGDALMLYTLSGAPLEAFEKLGHPRPTALFGPTFYGHPPIRSDDITQDARYGRWAPHHGMPPGHMPVRSYLAVSVISRSGEVLGGLFFGHPQPGVFSERAEKIIVAMAAQAAVAIDNARLYELSQKAAQERETLLERERTARAEAERLSRMKDDFLAMLAHELRNPLAPISTAAQLLTMPGLNEQRTRQASEIISRQVQHMVELVDDLLDVSRVTRGIVQLEKENVDLKAAIDSAIEQARPLIEAKGHALNLRTAGKNVHVRGDRTRLTQVIANLLNNAAKYTPPGGEINLTLAVHGAQASIDVTDNGTGIDAALLPHIFELFTQAERTPDRSQGGLGIGLALVKSIVALHGGQVTARSDGPNRGSRFTITLPLLEEQVADISSESEVTSGPVASKMIMVVDDNIDAAQSLATLLEMKGHTAVIAKDGATALKVAQHTPVQIYILDIGLPDMTGYELAGQLRERASSQNALFIALTGYGQSHDRACSESAGFHHHFVKPVRAEELMKVFACGAS